MTNFNFQNRTVIFGIASFLAIFLWSVLPVNAQDIIDTDGDGLSDQEELFFYYTDPNNSDTDGDGYSDYDEIFNGYSPRDAGQIKLTAVDSDNDGASDHWEIRLGLDILNPDTDGDGYTDGLEIINGYDPLKAGSDKVDKLIKVDIASQSLGYYFGGIELEHFLISGGVRSMPTPLGDFTVLAKVPTKNYGGTGFDFYYPNTKWNLHFTTDYWRYYIHGAYWHNNFGQPMSHGCVNVRYDQMERLYNFAQLGTRIEIK